MSIIFWVDALAYELCFADEIQAAGKNELHHLVRNSNATLNRVGVVRAIHKTLKR